MCSSDLSLPDGSIDKKINRSVGKRVLEKVLKEDIDPEIYVRDHQLAMVTDTGFLENIVNEVLAENEKSVLEYKNGNAKVVGFFIGKIMKKSQGKADPASVGKLLKKMLDEK